MQREQQIQFLNNINRLGFEDAVALISFDEVDVNTAKILCNYAEARLAVIDLITQETLDELEHESIM